MDKKFKKILVISVLFCLLPIVYGLVFYKNLPDMVPTHFDFEGNVNGYTKKEIFVFALPLLMAAVDLISGVMTYYDPFDKYRKNKNPKMIKFLLFIIPVMTNFAFFVSYRAASGDKGNYSYILGILVGVMFIFFGNYMPKNKRNATIGIKTPWTLKDDVNWNRTNILGGYLFVISGVLLIFSSVLKSKILISCSFFFMFLTLIGTYAYSFYLYKKSL